MNTFLKRLRYLILIVDKDTQIGCISQEFSAKTEAEEFFTQMTCSFDSKLIIYADLEAKHIIKYHATDLEWQCRFAGYFCYRGISSFENYATLK